MTEWYCKSEVFYILGVVLCLIVYLSSGLLDPEPLTEVDEEMVSEVDLYNTVTDEEREEILSELTKVVPPVSTFHLSVFQCLAWHVDRVGFRKRCLGDTFCSTLEGRDG